MRLRSDLWPPRPLDEVFAFFSDATNLEALTPPWLHFRILTPKPIGMHRGTLLEYRIRLHGIPISWQSEISVWDPPRQFVDVQRRGPYRRWEHTHSFADQGGGTTVGDLVDFEVPLGWLVGGFVMRDVKQIFAFRRQVLLQRFASPTSNGSNGPHR
ncbi:MAG: SRPBCC family protein [Vicinamibacterales bacterium]